MRVGQEYVFDPGSRDRQFRLLKIVHALFHPVIHKKKTPRKPFDKRAASGDLMREAMEENNE